MGCTSAKSNFSSHSARANRSQQTPSSTPSSPGKTRISDTELKSRFDDFDECD